MKKIFWGVLFILIGFATSIGDFSIEWTPDFIGYILIWMGMKELPILEDMAEKLKVAMLAIIVYAAVSWGYGMVASVDDMIGGSIASVVFWGSIFLDEGIKIYVLYKVTEVIGKLQQGEETDLNAHRLFRYWKGLSISIVGIWASSLGGMMLAGGAPSLALIGVIFMVVFLLLRLVISILLAVGIYQAGECYEKQSLNS